MAHTPELSPRMQAHPSGWGEDSFPTHQGSRLLFLFTFQPAFPPATKALHTLPSLYTDRSTKA